MRAHAHARAHVDRMKITERPLTVFDVETTGLDTSTARVVQFGHADFRKGVLLRLNDALINPCMPIPEAASDVHHIYDSDVADAHTFGMASADITRALAGADGHRAPTLCAYNGTKYDVPLLNAEFERHNVATRIDASRVLDPLVFLRFHRRHWPSRRLEAVAERLGCPSADALHRASVDAETTGRVLYQLIENGLIPDDDEEAWHVQAQMRTVLEHEESLYGHYLYIDRQNNHTLRIGFGKHIGLPIDRVPTSYLRWVLGLKGLPPFVTSEIRVYV